MSKMNMRSEKMIGISYDKHNFVYGQDP